MQEHWPMQSPSVLDLLVALVSTMDMPARDLDTYHYYRTTFDSLHPPQTLFASPSAGGNITLDWIFAFSNTHTLFFPTSWVLGSIRFGNISCRANATFGIPPANFLVPAGSATSASCAVHPHPSTKRANLPRSTDVDSIYKYTGCLHYQLQMAHDSSDASFTPLPQSLLVRRYCGHINHALVLNLGQYSDVSYAPWSHTMKVKSTGPAYSVDLWDHGST